MEAENKLNKKLFGIFPKIGNFWGSFHIFEMILFFFNCVTLHNWLSGLAGGQFFFDKMPAAADVAGILYCRLQIILLCNVFTVLYCNVLDGTILYALYCI